MITQLPDEEKRKQKTVFMRYEVFEIINGKIQPSGM
jgi:hypothetical protein